MSQYDDANRLVEEECDNCGQIMLCCKCRPEDFTPDYTRRCEVCGAKPVVPLTGLCGPCHFGEAATAGGNW